MRPPSTPLQWAALLATAAGVVALVGTGVALGSAFAPWIGWALVLLVLGVVVARLGVRALDERANDRLRDQLAPEPPRRPDPVGSLPAPPQVPPR